MASECVEQFSQGGDDGGVGSGANEGQLLAGSADVQRRKIGVQRRSVGLPEHTRVGLDLAADPSAALKLHLRRVGPREV